jgi:preprotein translocase subunit SecG
VLATTSTNKIVGVFVFMRLIHSLFWMDYTGPGIFNSVKVFFGRLYGAETPLENIATLTGILSFLIFVVAVVMSFINLPQKATPARPNTEGEAA